MPLDLETRDRLANDMLKMLRETSPNSTGNITLMRNLALGKEEFYEVRDFLVDTGRAMRAMGKGGATVYIPPVEEAVVTNPIEEQQREQDLYEPLRMTLGNDWAKDNGLRGSLLIDITGNQGSKKTGGKWSRPDLVIVAKKRYPYLNTSSTRVISFEVKPKGFLEDKTGVFETASHSVFAHTSYLLLHCEENEGAVNVSDISVLCKKFGIGLTLFSDPRDYSTFISVVEPDSRTPDLERIEEFIRIQIPETSKQLILGW